MKTIQIFLLVISMMTLSFAMSAQDYAGDFGWVGTTVNTSTTTVRACGVQNTIRLISSPDTHSPLGGSSVRFPSGGSPSTAITITIRFSQPVCNLRLKVNDLDYRYGTTITPPAESMTTSPMFSSIAPSFNPPGPLFNNIGGTLTPPVNVNETLGWVEFDGTPLSSVTLTYNRTQGYVAFLDSLTYDCCQDDCMCDDKDSKLDGKTTISNSGATNADLDISSAGVPISKLNISLPYYESTADADCIKCDPANISSYGKITNLPTIAGVAPSFVGPTTTGSAEIVYEFPTPTIINHSVQLDLQFPPTLDLKCCDNKVKYCIKIGLIDADCNICENLLCLPSLSTSGTGTGTSQSPQVNSKALLDRPASSSSRLLLNPNPASKVLNVILPEKAEGNLEILDMNGKSIQTKNTFSDKVTLNIENLKQGTYILKYTSGETFINELFVKQ